MSAHHPYSEKELLLQVAAGNEHAFNTLYEKYWRTVYSYIEPIVKSSVAEEIVIDIFLVLWQSRQRLPNIENLGAFLRTIARNKALDFIKTTARHKRRELAYRAEMLLRLPATPHDNLISKEVSEIYREAVAHLSAQRQKIFVMYREEGLSYIDIANKLEISPTTAKKSFFDALKAIRKYLEENYRPTEPPG